MTQPSIHTLSGVELVTIPAADYADLLDCKRQLAEFKVRQRGFESPPRSRIERDPEVAIFIADRLGQATSENILAECRVRFGAARTPSRSATQRYWSRLRLRRTRPTRTL